MAFNFVDRAWMGTATAGTGTITLGSRNAGYLTFAEAGVNDADIVHYVIIDGTNFERGIGTYTASGTTLSRTVISSLIAGVSGTTAVTLSGSATVFLTAFAADLANPVRVSQTVSFGPQTAGAPSFLPASSVSLTLTAQNLSATAPMLVTAAQGRANVNWQFITNISWASLTASSTLYLYVNTQTGATGFTTLAPIYQYGGTPAVTNNQFTFNIGEMTGYMGNGTTSPATPLVIVGEAVTGASTITSTVAYSYNGFYDSGFTATLPSSAAVVSRNSNIGTNLVVPSFITENTTAEFGFLLGDQIPIGLTYNGSNLTFIPFVNRRNVTVFAAGSGSGPWYANNPTSGAQVQLTLANWKYKIIVRRGW